MSIVGDIISEAKKAAEEQFDELHPCDPNHVDGEYLLRNKAEVASNATIALAEYDVNLNQAIIEIMIEIIKDQLYMYLGEEYSSLREWAHSKLDDITSERTVNRWLRVAVAMHQAYLDGITADPVDLYHQVGVTKAEVLATAQDLYSDPVEREEKSKEIISASSTSKAKEILETASGIKPKPIFVVHENNDGSTTMYSNMSHEEAMEFMVHNSNYADFRLDADD